MSAADLIFWYTGAGAWAIIAILVLVAIIAGIIATGLWFHRLGRRVIIEKLCLAKLRDLDLSHQDVIAAFRSVPWPAGHDALLAQIAAVQQELRTATDRRWQQRELTRIMLDGLSEDHLHRLAEVFRRYDLQKLFDRDERLKITREIVLAVARIDDQAA